MYSVLFFEESPVPGQTGTAALRRADETAGRMDSSSDPAGNGLGAFLNKSRRCSGAVPCPAGQVTQFICIICSISAVLDWHIKGWALGQSNSLELGG